MHSFCICLLVFYIYFYIFYLFLFVNAHQHVLAPHIQSVICICVSVVPSSASMITAYIPICCAMMLN